MCFPPSPPSPPPPPPPPPAPTPAPKPVSPQTQRARSDEKSRIRGMRGRQSTIRTSPQGLSDEANVTGKKLLGQ
mgnify:CR=1 FL=1